MNCSRRHPSGSVQSTALRTPVAPSRSRVSVASRSCRETSATAGIAGNSRTKRQRKRGSSVSGSGSPKGCRPNTAQVKACNAEYGNNGGAIINIVSKGGGKDYAGSVYYFLRNESLNGSPFFNNKARLKRPLYRHLYPGGNFGGPMPLPKFGEGGNFWLKDKAFFTPEELAHREEFIKALGVMTNSRWIKFLLWLERTVKGFGVRK